MPKRKGSKNALKGLQITDLPLAIIDNIAKHIVQDRDSDLRTDQAVAADLMNLSHTCRTLNAADVRGTLWMQFEEACPPVPACPLDHEFEVTDDPPVWWRQLTVQPSKPGRPGLRSAVTKAQKPPATWEEVSQCLDQDASMFSKEALIALLSTLGVGVTLYGVHFNQLKTALLARLAPKGYTLPLRVVLHLRNQACCFMSKAEAQRVYKLTDKDFDSLTRVESVPLHGRGAQYRRFDIVKAAQKRWGSTNNLQKRRKEVLDRRVHLRAELRQQLAEQFDAFLEEFIVPDSEEDNEICPECGLPWSAHL